jgi:hypothetical protein
LRSLAFMLPLLLPLLQLCILHSSLQLLLLLSLLP